MKSGTGRVSNIFRIRYAAFAALAAGGLVAHTARADAPNDWGFGYYGQLGTGRNGDSSTPVAPTNLTGGVSAVSAGGGFTLAVQNGGLLSWGYNFDGELGDGDISTGGTDGKATPVAVTGLTSGVTAIAAGNEHSLALKSGTVYAWGNNADGSLGNGTNTSSDVPIVVTGLAAGVSAIAAGADHSLAIVNHAVYSWGDNTYGQLGNGTFNASNVPVAVSALATGVTAITSGAWHNLAIKNGSLYAWGDNAKGQLGDGTTVSRTTPAAINGFASGVTAIAGGWGHSLVVQNGAVWAWGSNFLGQLGDGTSTDDLTPEHIDSTDLTNILTVAAGEYSSYALSSDGSLWTWGYNANGQLGLGSTTVDFRTPQHLVAPSGFVYTSVSANALGTHAVATLAPIAQTISSGPAYHFNANTGSSVAVRTVNGILLNANASAILDPASSHAGRQLLVDSSVLDLVGYVGHWSALVDAGNNDLDLQDSSLATVTDEVRQGYAGGKWNGSGGIASASAAADPRHLTALAVIQNNQSGTAAFNSTNKFDGTIPGASDILVKYTYYGDANLDGQVSSADYTRIDNGFLSKLTGWYNGDFNYDGAINGSDYTLIDNAFNTQSVALGAAEIATSAGSTSTVSVPEPVGLSLLVGALAFLRRRRYHVRDADILLATHASNGKDQLR